MVSDDIFDTVIHSRDPFTCMSFLQGSGRDEKNERENKYIKAGSFIKVYPIKSFFVVINYDEPEDCNDSFTLYCFVVYNNSIRLTSGKIHTTKRLFFFPYEKYCYLPSK